MRGDLGFCFTLRPLTPVFKAPACGMNLWSLAGTTGSSPATPILVLLLIVLCCLIRVFDFVSNVDHPRTMALASVGFWDAPTH